MRALAFASIVVCVAGCGTPVMGSDGGDAFAHDDVSDAMHDSGRDVGGDAPSSDVGDDAPDAPDAPCVACGGMDVSNVGFARVSTSAPDVTWSGTTSFDTGACSAPALVVMQGDGSEVCVVLAHDFTVDVLARVDVIGSRPLVVLAANDVHIDGVLNAGAHFQSPGPGGGRGGSFMAPDGSGAGRGIAGALMLSSASGGGGGGACGSGGAGGGGGPLAHGGAGGSATSTTLIPLVGGSGGAIGRGTTGTDAYGGAGGGAVQISALASIHVSGSIFAHGGGGDGGNVGAGAGGGSGGAILLEAPLLDVTGHLWTSGGGGGGAATGTLAGSAGDDGLDEVGAGPARGGAAGGTMNPGAGGAGGALTIASGAEGQSNTGMSGRGGGGGGGTGCVVLRDASGSYVPASSARLSPTSITSLPLLTR